MRSLEHCLSDIMRGVGGDNGPPDHLKGMLFYTFIFDNLIHSQELSIY